MSDNAQVNMLDAPGQTIVLMADRTPDAIARDGAEKSFSKELVESMGVAVHDWILSRIYRRFKDKNSAAHRMEIEVTVKLDGEPVDVMTVPFKLYIDGAHRWRAIR